MQANMSVLPSPSIQLARSLHSLNVEDVKDSSAFALFKTQLESQNTEAAVDAMKRLAVVALFEKTDLIPYLINFIHQPQPDELLLLLGQQLVIMMESDSRNATLEWLPIVERLASTEETVVRNQAVICFTTLIQTLDKGSIPAFVPVVKRLAGADWFTPKVSVCGILPTLIKYIPNSPSQQYELLSIYKELCTDDTPMVRRAASANLGQLTATAGWTHRDVIAIILPSLCKDEQDSVRRLAVPSLALAGSEFGEHPNWTVQNWLPLIKDASTDMSWRVRNHLAKNFSQVANVLGIQGDRRYTNEQALILSCFVALLTDIEAEVRAAAVAHLARMIAWGGEALYASHLQALLPALADDVVMEVRSKCALALMEAAAEHSLPDTVILQSFGPLLESFLQDEYHEVQLQVLSNLHKIASLLPNMNGVVTQLLQMSKASNWRVRQGAAQLLPHLAQARGVEFFQSVLLESAWMSLLLDPVAAVRSRIVSGMGQLVTVAGPDYIKDTLLPRHVEIYNKNQHTYLTRMTILAVHTEAAKQCAGTELYQLLKTELMRGVSDHVPNVRFTAIRGLGQLEDVEQNIIDTLESIMTSDPDDDCRHAATLALKNIKS